MKVPGPSGICLGFRRVRLIEIQFCVSGHLINSCVLKIDKHHATAGIRNEISNRVEHTVPRIVRDAEHVRRHGFDETRPAPAVGGVEATRGVIPPVEGGG